MRRSRAYTAEKTWQFRRKSASRIPGRNATARGSSATAARGRRVVTDHVHPLILIGISARPAVVPAWPSSGVLANAPAQGFRGRPLLTRVVADVFDLGAACAARQDDFWAVADQDHKGSLPQFRLHRQNSGSASLRGRLAPVAASSQLAPVESGRTQHYIDARDQQALTKVR
jgi:hypothetical protein